jgi:hypothetical protein
MECHVADLQFPLEDELLWIGLFGRVQLYCPYITINWQLRNCSHDERASPVASLQSPLREVE